MNYTRIYESIINRAKERTLTDGYERHHIIPRCLGGTDDKENLVKLTPEEHYVAHQLLTKMYPAHSGLAYAAILMCSNRATNKIYGWLRRRFQRLQSLNSNGILNNNYNKRWIANEAGAIQVPAELVSEKITNNEYIPGKKATRASCGHLVRNRCIPCENLKNIAYESRREENKKLANILFLEFKQSGVRSVCEFAKLKNTTQPRLSMLWKKHVLEYTENKKHGKSFF